MSKGKKLSDKTTAAKKTTAQQAAAPKRSIAEEITTSAPVSLPHLSTASEHAAQPATAIPHDEIRHRAYEFYCERGGQHGLHEADWYRAESELRSKHSS
jgi:hypothetical protein